MMKPHLMLPPKSAGADTFANPTWKGPRTAETVCSGYTNLCQFNIPYDANGQRIRKTTASGSVDFLYELSGHEVAEVSSTGVWNRGEVYAGGRHLATYTNGTTYFIHSDWLDTERARTTATGAPYETCTSLPFGDYGQRHS
jgi:hypothetical protein